MKRTIRMEIKMFEYLKISIQIEAIFQILGN